MPNTVDLDSILQNIDYQNNTLDNITTTDIPNLNTYSFSNTLIFLIVFSSVIYCFGCPFCCYMCSTCYKNTECMHHTCKCLANFHMDLWSLFFCKFPNYSNYINEEKNGYCDNINKYLCCSCCTCPSFYCKRKKVVIENLFEIVVTQPLDRDSVCVICHEEFGNKKHAVLSCGHKFHKKCINEWINISANKDCPTCRQKY